MFLRNILIAAACLTLPTLSATLPTATAATMSQPELVGSLLLPTGYIATNQFFIDDQPTRTNDGDADTRGAVQGTLDAIAGDASGSGGYAGLGVKEYSTSTQFVDLSRFTGDDALMAYDFDLSSYLATHAAGSSAGQYKYTLNLDLRSRRTDGGRPVVFYLSYNNGSSLTLDTTNVAGMTAGGTAAIDALVADTAHYVKIGTHPGNVEKDTYSWDITSDIAASTDGKVRIGVLVGGEYLGDMNLWNTSGIVASAVVPEPGSFAASIMLLGVVGIFGAGRNLRNRRLDR